MKAHLSENGLAKIVTVPKGDALPLETLYVLGTTLEGRAVGLVGNVTLQDLVH
jgi:hypothetical protein